MKTFRLFASCSRYYCVFALLLLSIYLYANTLFEHCVRDSRGSLLCTVHIYIYIAIIVFYGIRSSECRRMDDKVIINTQVKVLK